MRIGRKKDEKKLAEQKEEPEEDPGKLVWPAEEDEERPLADAEDAGRADIS